MNKETFLKYCSDIFDHFDQKLVKNNSFPVWKTITIGEQENSKTCVNALEKAGCKFTLWAGDILEKTKFSFEKQDVDLVRVTVSELGFSKDASFKEICARAAERGLNLCPAEVGSALRLAYKDQPAGEHLTIAMEFIADSNGIQSVFGVDRDGDGLWLYAGCGSPDGVWGAGYTFIFLRRK